MFKKGDLYTEFSGVEYEGHSEVKLTAIKHGDLAELTSTSFPFMVTEDGSFLKKILVLV